jgi:hypothetical protein
VSRLWIRKDIRSLWEAVMRITGALKVDTGFARAAEPVKKARQRL